MSSEISLLVIDVQRALFTDFGPLFQEQHLLSTIKTLIASARAAGSPVIYIQHCADEGEALAPATEGWKIHREIEPNADDTVIRKRFSDSFKNTSLADELESRGVKTLVITGLQTEYCVDTTCREAFSRDYNVTLVSDGHSTYDTDRLTAQDIIAHHNEVLGNGFASLRRSDEIDFNAMPAAATV
jgi:nicotinamidase-related amidase